MRTIKLTDTTHNLIILEQDDHGGFTSDDEGNVYLEINGRSHSDWEGYLASEISEKEIMELFKKMPFSGFMLLPTMYMVELISQTLKSAGLQLRKGKRAKSDDNVSSRYLMAKYFKESSIWDAAIPLSNIIIVQA